MSNANSLKGDKLHNAANNNHSALVSNRREVTVAATADRPEWPATVYA